MCLSPNRSLRPCLMACPGEREVTLNWFWLLLCIQVGLQGALGRCGEGSHGGGRRVEKGKRKGKGEKGEKKCVWGGALREFCTGGPGLG